MPRSTSSHSSSWKDMRRSIRLAPTEKFGASLVMTKASKLSPEPPGFSVWMMSEMMSAPRAFILEWNSMQATPSPRSTNEALEFFLTTPLDFFATSTDHTPAGTSTGLRFPLARSKQALPEGVFGSSAYQDFFPETSSFSTLAAIGRPSFFMRATVASTPAASQSSKGPSSQLKPRRMARSISTMESEISGMRLAEYVHRSERAAQRKAAALSGFCAGLPLRPNNIRTRAPVSSTFFAISRAANFGFWRGWYSRVFQSRARRSSSLPGLAGEDAPPTLLAGEGARA